MVESASACARAWDRRWQSALVQACGPDRKARLTRGELLKTGEGGLLAVSGALIVDEAPLGDEAIAGTDFIVSLPKRDADSWLRWLVGRASTLHERLDTAHMAPAVPLDERLVQARLRRWADRITSDDGKDVFERYLSSVGLDEPAARCAVGPAELREDTPLPVWAATLGEALFAPCYDALPGVCDPEHPLPFETLLLPFLHIYLRRVQVAASAGCGCLTPAAQYALARRLLVTLAALVRDALYAEFCRYRLADFAPLAPFVWGEPDVLYRRFVSQMQAGGLLEVIEAYPVLGRRLAEQAGLYGEAVGEFLRRLVADLPEIRRLWELADFGPVTEVIAGLSDPHHGGRQVFSLTFANGRRLIYKPKDMGIDVAYNALLAWLNAAGAPVTLRPLRVFDCHTHGWVECADPAPCADRAAATRYYQRAGALACLVYLLQGSDCHAENLIAAGEHPVLVDCETLLHPWPRAASRPGDGEGRRVRLNRLMRDSVLTSNLLPSLGEEDEHTFTTPGLCRPVVLRSRKPPNRWMHINTDRMAVSQGVTRPALRNNLPRLDGLPADVEAYVEPLIEGFCAMYRFLMVQRLALLAADGPLSAFHGRFVRFVFRSTHLYTLLSGFAMRLSALADGADHGLVFELLARAFPVSDPTPAHWPILAAERDALLRGDVPFFGAYTDQTALLLESGERIADYFACPSHDATQEQLCNLNEEDLAFQASLIRAAIEVYVDLLARAPDTVPA